MVEIDIAVGPLRARGLAMIDSGADNVLFPCDVLAPLGVKWNDLPSIGLKGGGAGGEFERRILAATIAFRTWTICDEIEVAEPGKLKVMLLGRAEFLSKFVVRFNWSHNPPTFDIDPVVPFKRGWSRKEKA